MSGLGRRTHYRKHLTDSVLYDFPEPSASNNERIAKVVCTRGSNQFDVRLAVQPQQQLQQEQERPIEVSSSATIENEDVTASTSRIGVDTVSNVVVLAILPTKFRKLIWLKRNDYVIVQYAADDNNSHHDIESTSDNNNNNNSQNNTPQHELPSQAKDEVDSVVPSSNGTDDDVVSSPLKSMPATSPNDALSTHGEGRSNGSGIRYMITHILYKNQIQHLVSKGMWPTYDPEFDVNKSKNMNDNSKCATTINTDDGIVYSNNSTYNTQRNYNNEDENEYDDEGDSGHNDGSYDDDDNDYETDDNDDLFVNTNRMAKIVLVDNSDDEGEE